MKKGVDWTDRLVYYSLMSSETAKDKILVVAKRMMLARGFSASSVDEICKAAGVSKGSFYHFFKSKEELGLTLLKEFFTQSLQVLARGKYMTMQDPKQRLFGFLDHTQAVAKELWSEGCLLGNFATEVGERNQKIQKQLSQIFSELAAQLGPFFLPAVRANKNRDQLARELAEQYLAVIEGSIVLARAHGDWKYVNQGLRNFRRQLELVAA